MSSDLSKGPSGPPRKLPCTVASKADFQKRFTTDQKNALLAAVLIDGHSIAEATRMAERGDLPCKAYVISKWYAYHVVKQHRERFELEHPEATARSTTNELRRLHGLNLKKARDLAETADPGEIARVAKALAETQKALAATQPTRRKPIRDEDHTSETNEKPATAKDDVLTRLLTTAKKPRPRQTTEPEPETNDVARAGSLANARNGTVA